MSRNLTYGFNDNKEKVGVWDEEYVNNQFQKVIYKDDIAVIYAHTTIQQGMNHATVNLYYPEGFNCNNSVIIAKEYSTQTDGSYKVFIDSECIRTWNRYASETTDGKVNLCTVILHFPENLTETITYDIRIALMKIQNYVEGNDPNLGD